MLLSNFQCAYYLFFTRRIPKNSNQTNSRAKVLATVSSPRGFAISSTLPISCFHLVFEESSTDLLMNKTASSPQSLSRTAPMSQSPPPTRPLWLRLSRLPSLTLQAHPTPRPSGNYTSPWQLPQAPLSPSLIVCPFPDILLHNGVSSLVAGSPGRGRAVNHCSLEEVEVIKKKKKKHTGGIFATELQHVNATVQKETNNARVPEAKQGAGCNCPVIL